MPSWWRSSGWPRVLFWPVLSEGGQVAVVMVGWTHQVREVSPRLAAVMEMLSVEVATALEGVRRRDALTTAAATDPLTGLPNRRWWDALIAREMADAAIAQTTISVAVIDLDHFKAWNDEHGHAAGDALLRDAATAWKRELRSGDLLARVGGDEFVVALPGCDAHHAVEIVSRLGRAIPDGATASSGVATWDGRGEHAGVDRTGGSGAVHVQGRRPRSHLARCLTDGSMVGGFAPVRGVRPPT